MRSANLAIVAFASALVLSGLTANAATISSAGSVVDDAGGQVTFWKTTSVGKSLDSDGDNVFGTLADLMYTIRYKNGGTLFSFDGSDPQVGPFPGYAQVDDPNGEPYPNTSHGLIPVRTTTDNGATGTGNAHDMFIFTVLTAGTPDFRLGIANDGLDNAGYSSASVGLRQVAGPSNTGATANLSATANNVIDMHFFDVRGAQIGDQFAVWGIGGAFGYVTHSIVTWDTLGPVTIPEPASLGMLGLAGLGVISRRRAR
jgi:hypothetical protein